MAKIGSSGLVAAMLWLLSSATALAGVLTGELDRTEGGLDDQFVYTLTIEGSFDGEPEFPQVQGLEARAAGQSQNISIVNGKYSKEVQVQYVLTPSKEGTFAIPPVKLKVDGKDMQTLPLEMKVSAAGAGSNRAGSASRNVPSSASADSEAGAGDGIFLERTFSKTQAYVGEAIGVKIKVFNRVKVAGAQPDFKYPSAFQVKNIEGQKSYTEMVGGNEYNVTELDAVVIPNREGDYKIDPAILTARVAVQRRTRSRSFFDDMLGSTELQEKRLHSSVATLKILPLPLEGRRKDFSGLVGNFSMAADVTPRAANAGDTLNLTINIEGQGAVSTMSEPTLPIDPSLAKVYKDKPDSHEDLDPNKGITSQKAFKYALVPNKPGSFNLGHLKVQIFNPEHAAYEDLDADLGKIEVSGSAIAVAPAPVAQSQTGDNLAPKASASGAKNEHKAVEVLSTDLVEPHSPKLLSGSDRLTQSDWMVGGLVTLLSLGSIGVASWFSRMRSPADEALRTQRANKAFKVSKKQLEMAHQCLQKQDLAAALRIAQGCFKDYTGAKFGVQGAAVTLRDIEGYLRSKEVDRDTLVELREVWSALDQMIYAPPLGQNPSRGEELLAKTRKILEQMERQC